MIKLNSTAIQININPRVLFRIFFFTSISFFILHIVGQLGTYIFRLDEDWFYFLNMDKELNLPSLFNFSLLLLSSWLIHFIAKYLPIYANDLWIFLNRLFIFLSIDELLQIHEIFIIPQFRPFLHPALASTWVIPYGVFLILIIVKLKRLLLSLTSATRRQFLFSGFIYISGSLFMEIVGSYLVRADIIRLHSIWYGLVTGIEELLELFGLILFINSLFYCISLYTHELRINLSISTKR